MPFTPQLEEKFQKLLSRYPVRRSALVPMLLYAQDEAGYLSKEIIEEIARRFELTVLDFLPNASALEDSSTFFHEVIGIIWYYMRVLFKF